MVADTTPPTIEVTLNRYSLWPPNHKMSPIMATVTAEDNCDPMVAFELTSITSNEPDNGLGDGDTADDIQQAAFGTPDLAFQLRSERSGTGTGRVYTIIYTAEDNAGNTATDTVAVRVSHDRSGMAANAVDPDGPAYAPLSERFGVVIRGSVMRDVALVDANEASLGNHLAAIRPRAARVRDVDGDGHLDLALVYDKETAVRLLWESGESNTVGLHYTLGGIDYLVDDIREIGVSMGGFEVVPGVGDDEVPAPEDASLPEEITARPTVTRGELLTLPTAGHVRVEIFNVQGRRVRTLADRFVAAGSLDLDWNERDDQGSSVPAGVYFYRIVAPGFRDVRKVQVVR
jgi:hypothetical protein